MNLLKLYMDALELAKKHGYRVVAFQRLDGDVIRREISNIDVEIQDTKEHEFKRTNGYIVDWQVIRNWNQRKIGSR